jgi:hypothetical protein
MGAKKGNSKKTDDEKSHKIVSKRNMLKCFVTTVHIIAFLLPLIIGLGWWYQVELLHHTENCSITKCEKAVLVDGCSYENCDVGCYDVYYNCTQTCITFEYTTGDKNTYSKDECFQTDTNIQCNITKSVKCYFENDEIQRTLALDDDAYESRKSPATIIFGLSCAISFIEILTTFIWFFANDDCCDICWCCGLFRN